MVEGLEVVQVAVWEVELVEVVALVEEAVVVKVVDLELVVVQEAVQVVV